MTGEPVTDLCAVRLDRFAWFVVRRAPELWLVDAQTTPVYALGLLLHNLARG